jgi:hypothetical protein
MNFPCINRLTLAVSLALFALPATALPVENLILQAENLPEDFSAHFFDSPLISRVELNGEYLGDAQILLSRQQTIQLVNFTHSQDSKLPSMLRNRWSTLLNKPFPLGKCEKNCPQGLQNVFYSLAESTLYIVTEDAAKSGGHSRHVDLPDGGSSGLILRNQINIVGGEVQPWSGYQNLQLQGSIGNWTAQASSQISRSDFENSETQARLNSLYLQREMPNHAIRAGLFLPDSQGILRQPMMPGRSNTQTLVGMMVSSSDQLLEAMAQPSLYPIFVTANRDSQVEIYRDGNLINSQPVSAGLQQLDTTLLPSGIYGIEVRVLENGTETSRSEETVYKPNNWRNLDNRWQYNIYGGVEKELGNNNSPQSTGGSAFGASTSYLLHPRIVVGAAVQHNTSNSQVGLSADLQVSDKGRFYGSVGVSDRWGSRFDTQYNWQVLPQTSLMMNHSQSWYQDENSRCTALSCSSSRQHNSGLTVNHRLNNGDNLSLRGSHNSKQSGVGVDANWRTRFKFKETPISLSVNMFDRPYSQNSNQRNRGANANVSFTFGGKNRSIYTSLGSRNDNKGSRDIFASIGASQHFEHGPVRQLSVGVTGDKHGFAGNIHSDFSSRYASGTVYAQQSGDSQKISGGLNLNNTVAIGNGQLSVSHSADGYASQSGMIVDVESDDPDVKLRAWDSQGSATTLRSGRNFIPVSAWKSGIVQIDFEGKDAPPLKIWPTELSYHLNKGGVTHSKVRIMKTMTVIGRVVDHNGEPLGGVKMVNHAGHGISESDGFVVTDVHEYTPELTMHLRNDKQCKITLEPSKIRKENNILMAGDLYCNPQ